MTLRWPPASATFMSPRKRVVTPTSLSAYSTAPAAESTVARVRRSIRLKSITSKRFAVSAALSLPLR